VYSYAVILWELYHLGNVPWAGELNIESKVLKKKRPPIDRTTPADIEHLMQRCWKQNPRHRPTARNISRYLIYGSTLPPK
jgi:hypothetical protein